MKIIVNADDLGLSQEINDAIFAHMTTGRVTSATVLANAAALDDAARRAKDFPRCSFGVHLNADEFRPLTASPALARLLDAEGNFIGNRVREIPVDGALRAAVFAEWSAQVERVRAAGFAISHFDSHHHIHTVPGLLPVLKALQKKFAVRRVRASMNLYPADAPAAWALRWKKAAWNFALRNYFATRTTDGFTSLEIFATKASRAGLEKKFRTMELMVHPGGADFASETALLATEWWRGLKFPVELMSYDEL
ncbi:MAG: hypothetical protein RLZZ350_463 [Verrucomicrobiota bacterium]